MNSGAKILGTSVYVFPGVVVHPTATIGHGSVIGFPSIDLPYSPDEELRTAIGPSVRVGCFCVIEAGAHLEAGVKVDHYVRVGPGTTIGENTYLLYGTRIHCDVRIGKRCIISGNCPDRTAIGDDVRHFGRLHHDYSTPSAPWDDVEEPSPSIGSRSVIGAGAVVIGGVRIGENVYISAGEVVRCDVPDRSVVHKGRIIPATGWRGKLSESGFFDWRGGR